MPQVPSSGSWPNPSILFLPDQNVPFHANFKSDFLMLWTSNCKVVDTTVFSKLYLII